EPRSLRTAQSRERSHARLAASAAWTASEGRRPGGTADSASLAQQAVGWFSERSQAGIDEVQGLAAARLIGGQHAPGDDLALGSPGNAELPANRIYHTFHARHFVRIVRASGQE